MSRFCLPRDIYHGKGCLEELKNLKGKKGDARRGRRLHESARDSLTGR